MIINDIQMTAQRPVIKNMLTGAGCAAAEIIVLALYFIFHIPSPQTMGQKTAEAVFFCVMMIFSLFLVLAVANCIRNITSPATFVMNNEKMFVFGFPIINIADIKDIEIINNNKKEEMKISLFGGEEAILKQSAVNVPLETIKYAIDIRREKE